jgi:hypothetical protein
VTVPPAQPMRRLLIVCINLRLLAAGVFPHLRPQKEMPRRRLDHIKAIEHLIDIFQANVLLRFAKQRD